MVIGAEIDILGAVAHQRVIQRDHLHLTAELGDHVLLGFFLVAENACAQQIVRQGDAGRQGHRHSVDVGRALQPLGRGIHRAGIFIRSIGDIGVHLIARVADPIHRVILMLFAVDLDALIGAGVRRLGIRRLRIRRFGVRRLRIRLPGLCLAGGILRILRPVPVLVHHDAGNNQHSGQNQHQHRDQRVHCIAAAPSASIGIAHPRCSLMMLSALSVSEVTHSTT